jgi:hypothetical protein
MPEVREHESRTAVGRILRDDIKEELSCARVRAAGIVTSFGIFLSVCALRVHAGMPAASIAPRNGGLHPQMT